MVLLKELILTVSTLERCGSLERTAFFTIPTLGMCGALERTDFNSFYFGRVWQS